jgi:hypothetical protein
VPDVGTDGLPDVGTDGLPDVGTDGLPDVGTDGLTVAAKPTGCTPPGLLATRTPRTSQR